VLEVLIPRANRHILHHGLTDDQAIERVTVVEGQCDEREQMVGLKGQESEPLACALLHEFV
jgi:hypothetical protein